LFFPPNSSAHKPKPSQHTKAENRSIPMFVLLLLLLLLSLLELLG
jgi:hypothetical protein